GTQVTARARRQGHRAGAVAGAAAGREAVAPAEFGTQAEVLSRRRQPAQLHAILAQLPAQEGLVGQRGVGKIPGMGMLAIHITHPREEAANLGLQAMWQGGGLHIRFFHGHLVVSVQAQRQGAEGVAVDVGAEQELGGTEVEAALQAAVAVPVAVVAVAMTASRHEAAKSEEHTSELQSRENLVCRLM